MAIWLLASQATTLQSWNTTGTAPQQAATKLGTEPGAANPAGPPDPSSNVAAVPDIKIPAVTADQLLRRTQMQPFLGIGLAALILILLVARRITTTREDKVEDSRSFRDALAIWHPAVFAADPTPRGLKRHQNRLRLQAMRLRPSHEQPDLLDRWFAVTPKTGGNGLDISEPTLVALGGIVALCDDVPDWSVTAHQPTPTAASSGPTRETIIARCAGNFENHFPHDWPPTQAAINAFKTLRRSL